MSTDFASLEVRVGDSWPMRELSSACPTPGFGAADRMDPYYDGLFGVGAAAGWVSQAEARSQIESGMGRVPRSLDIDQVEAVRRVLATPRWVERLAAMAVIDAWRTCTAEQMAALTGWAPLATVTGSSAAALFAAGVMDLGIVPRGFGGHTRIDRYTLVRQSRGDVFATQIAPHMTFVEWLAVTGGAPWKASGFYDRHNVLATELGLRVAEYVDEVPVVLGEKFSTHDMLCGSGAGVPPLDELANRRGDLTLVRNDGLRIVVEVTANAGHDFAKKAQVWARRLSLPGAEGLFVLFVTAEHAVPGSGRGRDTEVRASVSKAVSAAAREYPGSPRMPTARRMGVVSWREWFDDRHQLTERFLTGMVHRPTGSSDDRWEDATIFSDSDVAPGLRATDHVEAIFENAHLLLSMPHWLRNKSAAPDLRPHLMSVNGWSRLPAAEPAPDFGFADGLTRPASPPRRMRPQ